MSYLGVPRLHFAGMFFSDPSTANNIAQDYSPEATEPSHPEWNWNPNGAHMWLMKGCGVRSVVYADGTSCDDPAQDPVIGASVFGTDNPYPAKLVDLDPEQQYIPAIWGLQLRVETPSGYFLMGDFLPISTYDMWYRSMSGPHSGDPDSAFFQSVLERLVWRPPEGSRFFDEMFSASPELLSIKFVVDAYDKDPRSLSFNQGRVVGTIGPASLEEPAHFIGDRLLRPDPGPTQFDGTPCFFAPFRVDALGQRVLLDVGNSIPLVSYGGPSADLGEVQFVALGPQDPMSLGTLDYSREAYEKTAGIAEFPLSEAQLDRVQHTPLALASVGTSGQIEKILLQEDPQGENFRADQFLFRLNPGERAEAELYATRFGSPAANQELKLCLEPNILDELGLVVEGIPVCVPKAALSFPDTIETDATGRARVCFEAGDPQKARLGGALDGQVYTVRYIWNDQKDPDPQGFFSIRVFDRHPVPDHPNWTQDIGPIFEQYARLYPYMTKLFDLGDYDTVYQNLDMLKYFLTLPKSHPGHMPLSRDLSHDKRTMILKWVDQGAPR